jgi:hypothetical protein
MLPFIFKMSPVEAFAFLLGMSAVTNTTGDTGRANHRRHHR